MEDTYLTISEEGEGLYKEKGSKFIAFAKYVTSANQVKEIVEETRRQYHDARHVCYAYRLGFDGSETRAVDDSEPSGTAGKPILGAIQSKGLTRTLIVVVRYFGGTKLGVSGLINAYRTAAFDALENSKIEERTIDEDINISFDYVLMNDVMKLVKSISPQILEQGFEGVCTMKLRVRQSDAERLKSGLEKSGVKIDD